MNVALGRIVSGNQVRLQASADGADAALAASIAAIGVLQPVLLRPVYALTQIEGAPIPIDGGNRMLEIVDGHRRVAAAREAGFTEVPAEVRDMDDAAVAAAQAAGNALHQALHPVDLWLAARGMLQAGMSERVAAKAIGLSERDLRGMNWLANLDPSILGLCRIEMPDLRGLRKIALAAREVQQAAAELPGVRSINDYERSVRWELIAVACTEAPRPLRAWARFDLAAVDIAWDEDLFAEPGSDEQFSTTDHRGFMEAQRAALEAEAKANKKVIFLERDRRTGHAPLPPGYERDWGAETAARKHLTAHILQPSGRVETILPKPSKPAAKAASAGTDEGDNRADSDDREGAGDDGAEIADDPPSPAPEMTGITRAGMAMIAERKTQAVKARLVVGDDIDAHDLLALMVLAFACTNVSGGWHAHEVDAKLIAPDGTLRDDADERVIRACARTVLANVVRFTTGESFSDPGSGAAGEWIGRLINAEAHLGRFDDEKFLATLRGETLKKVAEAAQVKWQGTAKAMRDRLQGQAKDWTPDAAVFGAPGPRS